MTVRMTGMAVVALTLAGPSFASSELHIYNWDASTNPALIDRFEKAYDVQVTLEEYDSNATALAKVRAGGTGYDIVVPSDYTVKVMIEEGLLAETKPNQMENFKHLDPRWVDVYWDPGRNYSVPWQIGTTAFTVNTEKYRGPIDSYAVLFNPPEELKGRINMLPDMTSLIHAAERYLGVPRCSGDGESLKKIDDLLMAARPYWRSLSFDTLKVLTAGNVDVSQNWNGYSWRARQENPNLVYVYPKEGLEGWMDNVTVLKDAPNAENAKLFQNFVMAPENAALISEYTRYGNGIVGTGQFLDAGFASAPEILAPAGAPAPEFVPPCSKEAVEQYHRIWANLLR